MSKELRRYISYDGESFGKRGGHVCNVSVLDPKSRNGLQDSQVEWNFQKYLIGTDGHLEKVIAPQVTPMDAQIVDWIKK